MAENFPFDNSKFQYQTPNSIALFTNGDEKLRFDAKGYLGLGTHGPVEDRLKIQAERDQNDKFTLRVTDNSGSNDFFSIRNNGIISFGLGSSAEFVTNNGNNPLKISRYHRNDNFQELRIGVKYNVTTFHHINDGISNRLDFRMQNTDTGTAGNPNANNNIVLSIHGNKNGGSVGIGTTTIPTEKLEVRGKIKFGANGDLFTLGALQNLRMISGRVGSDGGIEIGAGFSASRLSNGHYNVIFTNSFATTPIILVTASGSTSEYNIIANTLNITASGFEVVVMNILSILWGGEVESAFDFIAFGG